MDIVARLIKFKESTGLSNSQFADQAGIPRPTLSQFLSGRNKRLSDELVSKLHASYPQLNVLWLLFGEGDMEAGANIETSGGKNLFEDTIEPIQPYDNGEVDESPILSSANSSPAPIYGSESRRAAPQYGIDAQQAAATTIQVTGEPAAGKTIKSIMVFYSDNSYETFIPTPHK